MKQSKRRKRTIANESEVDCIFELSRDSKSEFFVVLRELYISKTMCDICFNVGRSKFEAHRIVLAASQGFLGALVRTEMQECERFVYDIKDDPFYFKQCLDYVYGIPISIESSQVVPLLGLANSYSMMSLRDQLADRLEANLTIENCCTIFAAADTYSCNDLKNHALSLIYTNFAHTSKSLGFLELPAHLAILILSSNDVLDCDEAVVFEAATRWLEYTTSSTSGGGGGGGGEDRTDSAVILEVLRVVRYPLMDAGYLSDVIKGHKLMKSPERANLLMEAFEHHALRAAGRICVETERTTPRRQSCSFSQSTMLNGHQDSVSALVASGDWLLSGSWDTSIKVWATDSWQCVRTLSDHSDSIRGLCQCRDKVVSCSDDGTIKVWTPGTWTCVRSLSGHDGAVNAVVLCGERLASAGDDGVINLWNINNWACEVTVHHGSDEVSGSSLNIGVMSLEVTGEGSSLRLISGSDDAAIKIWNTSNWTCEQVLRAHQDEVWALRMSLDGTLITGSVDGTIRSWRYNSDQNTADGRGGGEREAAGEWECESVVTSSGGPVYALCCLEGRVVSAGSGSRIAVWGADWTLQNSFDSTEAGVWALAVCKNRLVSGGVDGTIRVWT